MRILLVEDEAPLRETLAARLKREGFAVDAAQDGEEGLYMGREVPFDVGIIDLGLPKMSGMELVKALRDEGARGRAAGVGPDARMPRSRGEDPLSDSVRRFERSNRGSRVLSAERMQSDGRDVNRIKAMDDRGRVRVYVDDPQRQRPQPPRERPARDDND